MGPIFTSVSLVGNQQNRLHRGFKKSAVENVIRIMLYERRERTNCTFAIPQNLSQDINLRLAKASTIKC
jgi:hypothetical protein